MGLHKGLTHKRLGCFVIKDLPIDNDAVLSVGIERIKRNIGDDTQIGAGILDRLDRTANHIVRVVSLARILGFQACLDIGKQRQGRNAKLFGMFGSLNQNIDRLAFDTGHGRDRGALVFAVNDKYRQDQIMGGQSGFRDHAARPVGHAVTALPGAGKGAIGEFIDHDLFSIL